MSSDEDRVKLVQSESEGLKQYLVGLPSDAWSRPSACDRWQVRDVVAHLASGAEFYLGNISRGLGGDLSPPEGYPPAGTGVRGAFPEANAQSAISVRERLGNQLLFTFNSTNDQLNQLLAGLGPQDRDNLCYHLIGNIPVRTYIDLRIAELAIHGWDIRSRLESEAHLSGGSQSVLMDRIPRFVERNFRPGSSLPAPVRLRFELTGAVPTRTDIVVEGDKARMEPTVAAGANVTFHSDTETFVLLMYGRLTLASAIADDQVLVEGDHGLAAQCSQWFKGI